MMPLEGIRILDMMVGQHGPVASQMLADMGGDVIKVEERLRGDSARLPRWVKIAREVIDEMA